MQEEEGEWYNISHHKILTEWGYDYEAIAADAKALESEREILESPVDPYLGKLRPAFAAPAPFVLRQGILAQSHPHFINGRKNEIRITGMLRILCDQMAEEKEMLSAVAAKKAITDKRELIPIQVVSRVPLLVFQKPKVIEQSLPQVRKCQDLEKLMKHLPNLWAHAYQETTAKLSTYGLPKAKVSIEDIKESPKSVGKAVTVGVKNKIGSPPKMKQKEDPHEKTMSQQPPSSLEKKITLKPSPSKVAPKLPPPSKKSS